MGLRPVLTNQDPNGYVSKSSSKSVSFEALKENGSSKKLHDGNATMADMSKRRKRSTRASFCSCFQITYIL